MSVVRQIVSRSGGAVSARPTATGAVECLRWAFGAGFQRCECRGSADADKAAITPAFLGLIGRELVRRGELVFNVDVPVDRLKLSPAADWDVNGGFDPEAWRYRLNLAGPSATTTIGNRPGTGRLTFYVGLRA